MALKSLDDTSVMTKKRRWTEGLQEYKWVEGWNRLRFFGDIYTDAVHWIKTSNGKMYPDYCLAYDWENDQFKDNRDTHCEACRLKISARVTHYINVISIDAFERMPKNKPLDWTCIFMVALPPSLLEQMINLKPMNDGFPVTNTLNGALLHIKYDPKSATPAQTYYAAVKTPNYAIDPEILTLTFTQNTPTKPVLCEAQGSTPAQWVYYRGSQSSDSEMKTSLRRHGYYEQETNSEVAKQAEDLMAELNATADQPTVSSGSVRQLAMLREEAADEAPPPKPAKMAPAADVTLTASAAPVPASVDELEIPF